MGCRYEVLVDEQARDMYDQYGLDGLSGGGGAGFSPEDLFEQLFNGGSFGFGSGRRKRRGDDSTIPYDVTLQDLYQGKTVKMQVEKTVVCSTCSGCVILGLIL
jgi:DnaJ family protein A protein 2